ncbi:MAG TPA: hypothetical protein VGH28_31730 [Polyangiaceae bacterium]|jgi:hypothetical protein
MRKWLALAIQVPLVAMLCAAGCNNGDDTTGDAGDAAQDVKPDKKAVPESGPIEASIECPTPNPTIDTSAITWVPPITPDPTACSDVQIAAFFDGCFGPQKSTSACQGFENANANANCLKCLITNQNASAYGALIAIGGIDYANTSGCIAILSGDSSATGCGAKAQSVLDCESLACADQCAVTDDASLQLYDQCTSAADQAVCKSYVDGQCDLTDAGAVNSICLNQPDFEHYYDALAPIFCGGYPADAGAGDAGTDAADDGAADAASDAPDGD